MSARSWLQNNFARTRLSAVSLLLERTSRKLRDVSLVEFGKEMPRRGARGQAQFTGRTTFDLRGQFGNLPHVSRFAPLAAIRHGRQVRTVGLEHEAVERRGDKRLANIPGVLERHDACEADQ